LFFDRNGPTKGIWYYEHPLPEGRKNYTKTKPLRDVEFEPLKKWWNNRKENEFAWCVPVNQIVDNEYNLDIKNPNSRQDLEHLPPDQLVDNILKKEQHIVEIMDEIRQVLAEGALR
ncbi:SAM-dependent methyltransferase, partial [bacterium]|nr:SAM-dependent methyltransferase [bacterium]